MRHSMQRNLPPMEVQSVNRQVNRQPVAPVNSPVKAINPLGWVREAMSRARLSQTYLAAAMGISEPLVSAQLSEHNLDKHLSMRRLGRVDDTGFWKEFALLILEDLGFHVVVMDREQYEAHGRMVVAAAEYVRVNVR